MSEQENKIYDLLIIGAGCAGASAGMYASRLNMKTAMVAEMPGGLITTTHLVENWPGIKSISGPDLAISLVDHATSFGAELINSKVTEVKAAVPATETGASGDTVDAKSQKSGYLVKTISGEYKAKAVLFATGTEHRKLGAPGEKEFENRGVSYCALCDGAFYKGKTVCIVGGGDSAAKEALFLAEQASKVYVFVRGDAMTAEPINAERIAKNEKIEVMYKTEIVEISGGDKVEKVKLKDGREMDMDGIFVAIGHKALSEVAANLGVALNTRGEIVINRKTETNLPGIYAAGDVSDTEFKQAITGSAEAVTAAYYASQYVGANEFRF